MSGDWTPADIKAANEAIVKRSMTDPAFRKLALTDPNAAIEQAAGKKVPAGFKIRFVENAGADATVVLPDAVDPSGELNDAQLEQVAGGGRGGGLAITNAACGCVASCGGISCAAISL